MKLISRVARVIIPVTLTCLPTVGRAQRSSVVTNVIDSARRLIEIANFADSVPAYESARAMLDRARAVAPKDPYVLHYLGYGAYRQGVNARVTHDLPRAAEYFGQAEQFLTASADQASIAENYALLALVYAQRAASDPAAAMQYGRRIAEELDMALRVGPKNPRVWLSRGIITMNMPAQYGGGLDPAREMLEKAIDLFDHERRTGLEPAWGHAEAFAWLGQIHELRGDRPGAAKLYTQGLVIEPHYRWIRDVLLPRASGNAK